MKNKKIILSLIVVLAIALLMIVLPNSVKAVDKPTLRIVSYGYVGGEYNPIPIQGNMYEYLNTKKQEFAQAISSLNETYNISNYDGEFTSTGPNTGKYVVPKTGDVNGFDITEVSDGIYEMRVLRQDIEIQLEKITEVDVSFVGPVVGTEITGVKTGEDEYMEYYEYSPDPNVSISTSNVNYNLAGGYWIKGFPSSFEENYMDMEGADVGVVTADKTYYAEAYLTPKAGYEFDENIVVRVNGATTGFEVNKSAQHLMIYMSAKSIAEAPKTEDPKTEDPKAEEPKAEEPKKEEQNAEEAKNTTYKVLNGAEQTVDIGKDEEMTFRMNIEYTDFQASGKVYVDDKEVANTNYTSKEGSTIITFKDEYTDSLSVGSHTLKVAVANGEVSTKFTIAKTETKNEETTTEDTTTETKSEAAKTTSNPKTGDNVVVYAVLFIVALTSSVILKKKIK